MVNAENSQNTPVASAGTVAQEVVGITVEKSDEKIAIEEGALGTSTSATPSVEDDDQSDVDSGSWQVSNNNPALLLRVESMLSDGSTPGEILRNLFPQLNINAEQYSDHVILGILSDILDRPPVRTKLPHYNTLQDAIELFRTKKRILILTGAGVSVSCGIPDFRSKDGIYARLHNDFPDLPDPTAMFDIRYFKQNPAPFYDFAKELFPGQFTPSVSHRFIKGLEDNNQLLRNYTQNIDTLEHQTGIKRVIECHGSFSKASCLKCSAKFDGDVVKDDVMNKRVARCKECKDGIIKPDIVFFGEDLGQNFHRQMSEDKNNVDLVVVIGSSLKVRPVSLIPFSIDKNVPQILINREPLPAYRADIELLGNCDDIIREICFSLGGMFEEVVRSYDRDIEKKSAKNEQLATRKRKLIELDEFQKLMTSSEEPESSVFENDSKRPRLDTETTRRNAELASCYEMRYVSIEKKLPPMSCVRVSRNQTVFPGAEITYDLEAKIVCRAPVRRVRGIEGMGGMDDDSDDSDDDGSSSSEDSVKLERTTSVDNLEIRHDNAEEETNVQQLIDHCDSCPPFLEFEESNPINPVDFRQACIELTQQFDKS